MGSNCSICGAAMDTAGDCPNRFDHMHQPRDVPAFEFPPREPGAPGNPHGARFVVEVPWEGIVERLDRIANALENGDRPVLRVVRHENEVIETGTGPLKVEDSAVGHGLANGPDVQIDWDRSEIEEMVKTTEAYCHGCEHFTRNRVERPKSCRAPWSQASLCFADWTNGGKHGPAEVTEQKAPQVCPLPEGWTKDAPTENGFYIWSNGHNDVEIVQVIKHGDGDAVMYWTDAPEPSRLFGWWLPGPLQFPKVPKENER